MDLLTADHARLLDVVVLIRAYCLLCTFVILTASLIPAARKRFLAYGARGQTTSEAGRSQPSGDDHVCAALLDWLASIEVPHSWFTHFYVLSLLSSFFWLTQITMNSKLMQIAGAFVSNHHPTTRYDESLLCTALMLLQSVRRLWESHQFSQTSESKMWIGHYVFGLSFYLVANVAVWIEGVHSIIGSNDARKTLSMSIDEYRVALAVLLFLTSSMIQYSAHAHLASLRKYSVPHHPLFRYLVAPHYTSECVLYLALAMIAAPEQCWFNRSLLCVVCLTSVNLSITAKGTKKWMMEKFRDQREEIDKKSCVIPGVF